MMKTEWRFEGVRNHTEPTVHWRVCRIRNCRFEYSVYKFDVILTVHRR